MADNYAPCPKCGTPEPKLLKFTWWGGALGPKMLKHVKCQSCGNKYNGKTGGDNTVGITVYMAVVALMSFVLVSVMIAFLFGR